MIKKTEKKSSTTWEIFSVVRCCGLGTKIYFCIGCVASFGNGLVFPLLAYLFSSSLSALSGANISSNDVNRASISFLLLGSYAWATSSMQMACFDIVSSRASRLFRLKWFEALLRQDAAFYDINGTQEMANSMASMSKDFAKGVGLKLGEAIRFLTAFVFGIAFAFYSSWRCALLILCVVPFMALSAYFIVVTNQSKASNQQKAYSEAGCIAYTTLSSIQTALSLNAIPQIIQQYSEATLHAYNKSISTLWKEGLAHGALLGCFISLHGIITVFGTFLIYKNIRETGCDPSGVVQKDNICHINGASVFGALLGVIFAAQGIAPVSNFLEIFSAARVAHFHADQVISRTRNVNNGVLMGNVRSEVSDIELCDNDLRGKVHLPPYAIDSSSLSGVKPEDVQGVICFENVTFSYPIRPDVKVLSAFNLTIPAGKTVALVGSSGGGKTTCLSLVERFYDPINGNIKLDGVNLKEYNVKYLRSLIGYVGQEPVLFETTIEDNIRCGNLHATKQEIIVAAKEANAHGFIMSFPMGYDTPCGNQGTQLSGGQKQRIAIARVLVRRPKIILLDEATSALDSESEYLIQQALDNVLGDATCTKIVIAHRLSTIRNADSIAVVVKGKVVEQGNHKELMDRVKGQYRSLVVKQQEKDESPSFPKNEVHCSLDDEVEMAIVSPTDANFSKNEEIAVEMPDNRKGVIFRFKDVQFAYPARSEKLVLDCFNLIIRRGETLALVGPSGGGKSTVVSLMERFYDPLAGDIEYCNINIRQLNKTWYRDQLGYVGQEPTLFNTSIARNITYGNPSATQDDIEQAAKMANAHDFIMSFPNGYETQVGDEASQLSGGQKQRIALARAIVKKPPIFILDEATSALDSNTEFVVQQALDRLMESSQHTTIVIAHRLATIQNADHIAFISNGKVLEFSTHDMLMKDPKSHYRRFVEYQRNAQEATLNDIASKSTTSPPDTIAEDGIKETKESPNNRRSVDKTQIDEKTSSSTPFIGKRARELAKPDAAYIVVGATGSILVGATFPIWGILLAKAVDLLYRRVGDCVDEQAIETGSENFSFCDTYYSSVAAEMRRVSFELGGYFLGTIVGCITGSLLVYLGLGFASERLNKRVRNSAFSSLVRQEVGFFDQQIVGNLTSQLEHDATRMHAFSGEPIRSFVGATSSVLTGLVISFVYMWPFALSSIASIPFMALAANREQKKMLAKVENSNLPAENDPKSPDAIVLETLVNIRTVAVLSLESIRLQEYQDALSISEPCNVINKFKSGCLGGITQFIQQSVHALNCWFGGWLIFNYPASFQFEDFLVSMLTLMFSLFGLGLAFQDISDRKQVEACACRIFSLIDRKSANDPLSEQGIKLG